MRSSKESIRNRKNMLKSAIDGIKLITNSERLVYVLWFASGSPGLSGRRCLSISRVAYTWNPTVSRGSTEVMVIFMISNSMERQK